MPDYSTSTRPSSLLRRVGDRTAAPCIFKPSRLSSRFKLQMHHVHNIDEIITQIIDDCDWRTTVACARVCKLWSEIALNKIWHTLDGVRAALFTSPKSYRGSGGCEALETGDKSKVRLTVSLMDSRLCSGAQSHLGSF